MKIKPLGERVLIELVKEEEVSKVESLFLILREETLKEVIVGTVN